MASRSSFRRNGHDTVFDRRALHRVGGSVLPRYRLHLSGNYIDQDRMRDAGVLECQVCVQRREHASGPAVGSEPVGHDRFSGSRAESVSQEGKPA